MISRRKNEKNKMESKITVQWDKKKKREKNIKPPENGKTDSRRKKKTQLCHQKGIGPLLPFIVLSVAL